MLEDTDTVALINRIQEVRDPSAWFKGDWPLQNHFYRPISTLAFEFDVVMSDGYEGEISPFYAANFGRMQAVYAIACILLLFWFLREATNSPWLTGVSTALFAVWHISDVPLQWLGLALSWAWVLCLLGLLRGGREKLWPIALGACGCLFLSESLLPVEAFASRIVEWLPGRTASVMTMFALLSLASYARVVRLGALRALPAATSEDVPATKSATVGGLGRVEGAVLISLSVVGLLLALGSYEQAVMVPALLFGVWLMFWLRGYRSGWWPHIVFWSVLAGYLVLRSQLVPTDVSGYQDQQFRSGPGVWIVLGDYVLPSAYGLFGLWGTLSAGWAVVITSQFWTPVITAVGNFGALWQGLIARESRWMFVGFFLLSLVAFLPMAWLHPFGHYHYLPSAFRAPFVVLLCVAVFRLVASAVSLPGLLAPERRSPAPGSLLRP